MRFISRIGIVALMIAVIAVAGTGCGKKTEDKHDAHAEEGHSDHDGHDHSKN